MIPSASDLTYFIEIASTGNLSRAAERLGVSQPSLTLALQRLEHSIGTGLFLRSKKGVSLTPAGKILLLKAKVLLQEWESIQSKAVASHQEVHGTYSLGCHASVALYSLPEAISEAVRTYPELELQLSHDLSRKIAEAVISVRLDMGVVVNPVRHPDLVIRKVCDDEVTFWQAAQGPVAKDVLICDTDLLQTQELLKKLKKSGLDIQRRILSSNLEVVAEMTAAGCGIGILPGRVAQRNPHHKLTKVKAAPVFKDEICVIYRVENKSLKAIQVLTNLIEKALTGA